MTFSAARPTAEETRRFLVFPAASKSQAGFSQIVEFSTVEVRRAWQNAAAAALADHVSELLNPPGSEVDAHDF